MLLIMMFSGAFPITTTTTSRIQHEREEASQQQQQQQRDLMPFTVFVFEIQLELTNDFFSLNSP